MTQMKHNRRQVALTIVKIINSHSVVFLKIQSRVKIVPQFEGTYKILDIVL